MKRFLTYCGSLVLMVGLGATAWADCSGGCGNGRCAGQCTTPPPPDCPDCTGPCDDLFRVPALFGCEHTRKIIDDLHGDTCCDRIKAARKLGCRLHADFCADPEVLTALISALQCDPCWEVRSAAAWSILGQKARTDQGVLALYIASKLDPHNQVRARAAEALDILTIGKRACFKAVFENGDSLIKELKKLGYKPGSANCAVILGDCGVTPKVETPKKAVEGTITLPPGVSVPGRPLPTGTP